MTYHGGTWYTPSSSLPRRNDGENVPNEMMRGGNNNNNNNNNKCNGRLQNQIDDQLSRCFPLADFGQSSNSLKCSDSYSSNTDGGIEQSATEYGLSRSAAFFHPRQQVPAHKMIFSPITNPSEGVDNTMALGENHTSQFSQQQQEEKEAHTLHLQGATRPQVNAQQQQLMVGADIESSLGQHSSNPNGLTHHHDDDDDPFESFMGKSKVVTKPKQTKLIRDSNTGQMKSSLDKTKKGGEKRSINKSWDDYGGRPMVDDRKEGEINPGDKEKKKKKKKKKKKTDDEAKAETTKSKKKQKKLVRLEGTGTELEIPMYNIDDVPTDQTTESAYQLTEHDFHGIEQMQLQNAASCSEGLEAFLAQLGRQKQVAFTMLFLDPRTSAHAGGEGKKKKSKTKSVRSKKFTMQHSSRGYECTSPFLPSSKKYCTPKGNDCTHWNCTCDNQLRALRAQAALLGAMFVFQDGGNLECYLLPLGPTNNEEIEYKRMESWPVIPFQCGVSLSDRWAAFEAILLNERTKLVTYNGTVSLLPYYQHLACDEAANSTKQDSFAACISGGEEHSAIRNDGYIGSIWDLRLVAWMLRENAKDEELEFSKFQEGFSHLASSQQAYSDMPAVMQGCLSAKNSLELVNTLYSIMNEQLEKGGLLGKLTNQNDLSCYNV